MKKIILIAALCVSSVSMADVRRGPIFDGDLSGPRTRPPTRLLSLDLVPDRIEVSDEEQPLTVEMFRMNHGQATPVAGLTVTQSRLSRKFVSKTDRSGMARLATCGLGGDSALVTAPLQDERIAVTDGGRGTFQVKAQLPCRGRVKLYFEQSSNGGQAVGIWQVAFLAKTKLQAEIGLEFWNRPLVFVWPADGDYYDGRVNLTRGDYWDVVGHEMGHAIYDLGDLGAFGGGSHKIDECYSAALALSEGWASYFSAWVSVDLRDPDAKFEFMVPRRAPIRFETIPADVCRGQESEWRVTGFFWDLNDLHQDGENSIVGFKPVWQALFHRHAQDMDEVKTLLLRTGYDPRLLEAIWNVNF